MNLDDIGTDPSVLLGDRRDDWNSEGVFILPGFYERDDALLHDYEACWQREHGEGWPPRSPQGWVGSDGGWPDPIPYMRHPEIIQIVAPLAPFLDEVLDGPAGMHLNLTGWVSTQRDWHQDSYLNPPNVGDRYVALWLALEDIDPDSGPFQYVAGSHRWPQVTRESCWRAMEDAGVPIDPRTWPTESERVLSPIFEKEIAHRGAEITTYLPKRGDVLLWHGRLLHRGSKPNVPGMRRKALIVHCSRVDARPDMPTPVQHESGLWIFPFGT